jgi:hypothetical protein
VKRRSKRAYQRRKMAGEKQGQVETSSAKSKNRRGERGGEKQSELSRLMIEGVGNSWNVKRRHNTTYQIERSQGESSAKSEICSPLKKRAEEKRGQEKRSGTSHLMIRAVGNNRNVEIRSKTTYQRAERSGSMPPQVRDRGPLNNTAEEKGGKRAIRYKQGDDEKQYDTTGT